MTSPFEDVGLERLRRRRTAKWTLYGDDVLAAWVAEMDFRVAPVVRRALLDAVEREDFGYLVADLTELTTACTGYLRDAHGWDVPPTRVFPVADVLAGIRAVLEELGAPGSEVIVPTPAYPPFFEVVELSGHRVVEVPLAVEDGRSSFDLDAIDAAFAAGARAIIVCNPHNPTGRVFGIEEMAALTEIVDRHGGRVVADEVHAPLVYPGQRHAPYASTSETAATHTTTVMSASKAWNIPGLRCAQVVTSNHADAARWRRLPVFAVPAPTPIGVAASVAAYTRGRDWLADLLVHLDGQRRRLADLVSVELPEVGYRPPEGTYLAWLDCRALGLDDPARFFLDHARVALNDGPAFGSGAQHHVRLNFATSTELLERIVTAMGTAVRSRR